MPAVSAFSPTPIQRPKLHRRSSSSSRVRPRLQVVPISPVAPVSKSPVKTTAAFSSSKKTIRANDSMGRMPNLSPMSPSTTSTSQPVFIPISRPRNAASSHRANGKHGNGQRARQGHEGVAPAVAALLAVTSIPPPRRSGKLQKRQPPRSNPSRVPLSPSDVDSDDSFFEKSPVLRPFSRTVMSVLLSPPEYLGDDDQFTLGSPPNSITSVRSLSSDSVPSLSADEDSSLASWSGPSPPTFQSPSRRSQPRRFNKMSPLEDSLSDHPLIQSELDEADDAAVEAQIANAKQQEEKNTKGLGRMSFKSNLTASLRVLKSAAKSFSNLSTPLLQPDDFLTRSILSISPQYNTDEKRPAFSDIPSPELRRYLNPRPLPKPCDSFTFSDYADNCTVSIQLQTYNSSVPKDRAASSDSGVQMARPREVRENGDFLRIIVLEMNMRRGGKLSDTSQGKARFVLPPRQPYKGRPRTWTLLKFD